MRQIERSIIFFDMEILSQPKTADLNALNRLMECSKAFWGYDEPFMKRFMDRFALDLDYLENSLTRVLRIDREDAGFFSLSLKDGGWELDNFFVHPNFIGRGVGKKLWHYMEKEARCMAIARLRLTADPNAAPFYQKMGGQQAGYGPSPLASGRYCHIFSVTLAEQ